MTEPSSPPMPCPTCPICGELTAEHTDGQQFACVTEDCPAWTGSFAPREVWNRRLSLPRDTEQDGVSLIAAERERQTQVEGWTTEHDDEHTDESLACAAAVYALPEAKRGKRSEPAEGRGMYRVPQLWPRSWHAGWWKPEPENRVCELVKAGALIAAEIDRLRRAAMSQSSQGNANETR